MFWKYYSQIQAKLNRFPRRTNLVPCRLTTHSTGARIALLSSARLAAYDVVSAPG